MANAMIAITKAIVPNVVTSTLGVGIVGNVRHIFASNWIEFKEN